MTWTWYSVRLKEKISSMERPPSPNYPRSTADSFQVLWSKLKRWESIISSFLGPLQPVDADPHEHNTFICVERLQSSRGKWGMCAFFHFGEPASIRLPPSGHECNAKLITPEGAALPSAYICCTPTHTYTFQTKQRRERKPSFTAKWWWIAHFQKYQS